MKFEFPIWENLDTKNRIRVKATQEDGTSSVMLIPVDDTNEHYQSLLEQVSMDEVDTNSEQLRQAGAEGREKSAAQQAEKAEQKRANTLFNAKIEAFEMPIVQSASKAWKAKIRKATTSVEVVAIVAALIIKAGEPVEESAEAK